jgi:hypothetical protein
LENLHNFIVNQAPVPAIHNQQEQVRHLPPTPPFTLQRLPQKLIQLYPALGVAPQGSPINQFLVKIFGTSEIARKIQGIQKSNILQLSNNISKQQKQHPKI